MLNLSDVHLNKTVAHRALMDSKPHFKDSVAYVRFVNRFGYPIVCEFERKRGRWLCYGIGRGELPYYEGMFTVDAPLSASEHLTSSLSVVR